MQQRGGNDFLEEGLRGFADGSGAETLAEGALVRTVIGLAIEDVLIAGGGEHGREVGKGVQVFRASDDFVVRRKGLCGPARGHEKVCLRDYVTRSEST